VRGRRSGLVRHTSSVIAAAGAAVAIGDRSGRRLDAAVRGLRPNASTMSHAELDDAETFDIGDIEDFGARYGELHRRLPQISVLGGC
jgi:hypothetical protein